MLCVIFLCENRVNQLTQMIVKTLGVKTGM